MIPPTSSRHFHFKLCCALPLHAHAAGDDSLALDVVEGSSGTLACPNGGVISIQDAVYGRRERGPFCRAATSYRHVALLQQPLVSVAAPCSDAPGGGPAHADLAAVLRHSCLQRDSASLPGLAVWCSNGATAGKGVPSQPPMPSLVTRALGSASACGCSTGERLNGLKVPALSPTAQPWCKPAFVAQQSPAALAL